MLEFGRCVRRALTNGCKPHPLRYGRHELCLLCRGDKACHGHAELDPMKAVVKQALPSTGQHVFAFDGLRPRSSTVLSATSATRYSLLTARCRTVSINL
jgi:hypothetical protein